MRPHFHVLAALSVATVLFAGCAKAPKHQVTVFAAASLTEAFSELSTHYEQDHPGVTVAMTFAGSQQLLAQLALGAKADVYAAASPRELRSAEEQHLLTGESAIFARNSLVIVVPAGNPAAISSPADLAKPGARIALAGADVPVGAYSRAALTKLARAPGAPPEFERRALANVATEEDDVKQVVAKVQLGEVDAGIVYATDAKAAGLPTIAIPAAYNQEATYPIAEVAETKESALAKTFIAFLLSDQGQAIMAKYGFGRGGNR